MELYTPNIEDVIKYIFLSLTDNIIPNKTVMVNKIGDDIIPKLAVSFSSNNKIYKFNETITPYICAIDKEGTLIEKEITLISKDRDVIYIPITNDISSNKKVLEAIIKIVSEQGTLYSHPFTIVIN